MRTWTVEDEINLCKWVDDRGFKLVYLPQIEAIGNQGLTGEGEAV